jgi:Flp pilus assembly protein TadB
MAGTLRCSGREAQTDVKATSRRQAEPVLITEAEPSLDDQFRTRRRKYAIMMSTRALCLVLAAVFYRTWWLMVIFVVGAVVLPWMAVIIANDRPPRKAEKVNRYAGHPDPSRAIEAPTDNGRVIEG